MINIDLIFVHFVDSVLVFIADFIVLCIALHFSFVKVLLLGSVYSALISSMSCLG